MMMRCKVTWPVGHKQLLLLSVEKEKENIKAPWCWGIVVQKRMGMALIDFIVCFMVYKKLFLCTREAKFFLLRHDLLPLFPLSVF